MKNEGRFSVLRWSGSAESKEVLLTRGGDREGEEGAVKLLKTTERKGGLLVVPVADLERWCQIKGKS